MAEKLKECRTEWQTAEWQADRQSLWKIERLRRRETRRLTNGSKWKDERVTEWQSRRVTEWQSERMTEWQCDGWSNDRYADWETYKAGRLKNCMKVLLKFLFYEIRSFIFAEEKHILLNFSTRVLRLTGKRGAYLWNQSMSLNQKCFPRDL